MKITTVNLPYKILKITKKAVDMGLFPSRSELIRYCVMDYMDELILDIKEIDAMAKREDVVNIKRFLSERGYKLVRTSPNESSYCKRKNRQPLGNPFWREVYNKTTNTIMKIPIEEIE